MITLLTPYGRTETTAAALRLADFVVSTGEEVRVVACGQREAAVHPAWDARVLSGARPTAVCKAVCGARAVVHFQANHRWFGRAVIGNAAAKRTRQILVANRHGISADHADLLPRYDLVVCPSRDCLRHVATIVSPAGATSEVCRWGAGVAAVRRSDALMPGRVLACVVCDAAAVAAAPRVAALVEHYLEAHPTLDLSVASLKSWPDREQSYLVGLRAAHRGRLRLCRPAGPGALVKEFHAHDWVLFPGGRADFGFYAVLAAACGAVVVAPVAAPFGELAAPRVGVGSPDDAAMVYDEWVAAGAAVFADPATLRQFHRQDWGLAEAEAAFTAYWRGVLAP